MVGMIKFPHGRPPREDQHLSRQKDAEPTEKDVRRHHDPYGFSDSKGDSDFGRVIE